MTYYKNILITAEVGLAATGATGFLHIRGDPISGSPVGLDKIQLNGFHLFVQFFADGVRDTTFLEDFVVC